MVEFQVGGPVVLGGVAPGVTVPVTGSLAAAPPGYIGTVAFIGTIGTLQSGGGGGGGAGYATVVVGTVQNAPLVTVQGMVAVGMAGYVATVAQTGTLGTLLSPITIGSVMGTVTVAEDPAITQVFGGTAILTGATLTANGAATVAMGSLQDLVVKYVFGAAVAGSVLPYIADVEEQTGFQTATIVAGAWFAGTVRGGHRLVAPGPLGYLVAVGWMVASGGTVGSGTVTNVYISAWLSEGP